MAIGIVAFDLGIVSCPTSNRKFKMTGRNFRIKISTYEKFIYCTCRFCGSFNNLRYLSTEYS